MALPTPIFPQLGGANTCLRYCSRLHQCLLGVILLRGLAQYAHAHVVRRAHWKWMMCEARSRQFEV